MFTLVSIHSPEYRELSDLTWNKNKALFCDEHRLGGWCKEIPFSPKMCFNKFKMARGIFKRYPHTRWVWATGCDSMITNFKNDLRDIVANTEASLLVATDRNGINADSFFIKNSDAGLGIIAQILELEPSVNEEQSAIIKLSSDNRFTGHISIRPQREFNSYNYDLYPSPEQRFDKLGTDGHWQPGDLLIHWPGFADNVKMRIGWAKEYINKVIY